MEWWKHSRIMHDQTCWLFQEFPIWSFWCVYLHFLFFFQRVLRVCKHETPSSTRPGISVYSLQTFQKRDALCVLSVTAEAAREDEGLSPVGAVVESARKPCLLPGCCHRNRTNSIEGCMIQLRCMKNCIFVILVKTNNWMNESERLVTLKDSFEWSLDDFRQQGW